MPQVGPLSCVLLCMSRDGTDAVVAQQYCCECQLDILFGAFLFFAPDLIKCVLCVAPMLAQPSSLRNSSPDARVGPANVRGPPARAHFGYMFHSPTRDVCCYEAWSPSGLCVCIVECPLGMPASSPSHQGPENASARAPLVIRGALRQRSPGLLPSAFV